MSSILNNQLIPSGLTPSTLPYQGLPRPVEFVLALFGIVLLAPILLLCMILVRSSSPGAIFFRQLRVGRGGKTFTLYKFRTMIVSDGGSLITAATDHRITRTGRILRQWKLDELPELYNVLRGEMSFVGPRPEVPELLDFSDPAWSFILRSRPGITDPVTLILRNEEAVLATVEDKEAFYRDVIQPFKLKGYVKYLETRNLRTDIAIVAQTAKAILLPSTARQPFEEPHLFYVK